MLEHVVQELEVLYSVPRACICSHKVYPSIGRGIGDDQTTKLMYLGVKHRAAWARGLSFALAGPVERPVERTLFRATTWTPPPHFDLQRRVSPPYAHTRTYTHTLTRTHFTPATVYELEGQHRNGNLVKVERL
jgi:hypothetical protein